MKIIKDLGIIEKGVYKKRMCIAECKSCGGTSVKPYSSTKNNPDRVCKSCAMKSIQKNRGNGMKVKRIYSIYRNMKTRCYNINYKERRNYGGRGITICEEWLNDYNSFEKWSLKNGYSDNLSIDRIDNNKGYSPENCRWTDKTIQSCNTRLLRVDNKTGYRGVRMEDGKYLATITYRKKSFNLGRYKTALEGAIAYDRFVLENGMEHTINGVIDEEI